MVTTTPQTPDSPDAQLLLAQLDAYLLRLYPEESPSLDPAEVVPGRGAFMVARVDGVAVGCGALRRRSDGSGELKRLWVGPAERRHGVARALLTALEAEAATLGLAPLVLETGVHQPEAIAFYRAHRYRTVANFGEYADNPDSICMAKDPADRA